VVRPSFAGRILFPALTVLLPLHILIVAFLFGGLRLSASSVRALAAWKEMALLIGVGTVILRAAFGRGSRSRITWLDLAVASIIGLAAVYLIAPNIFLPVVLTPQQKLLGFRDVTYFFLAYFIGRATPDIAADDRFLKRLYLAGAFTSVVALCEQILVTPEHLVLLGAASYFQNFLGVAAFTEGNEYGLPANYWTLIGGRLFQRSGSVYLSSQGFAVPFVLLMPAATVWMLQERRRRGWWFLYLVTWAGLIASVTRMTIVACVLEMVLLTVLIRRPRMLVKIAAGMAAIFTGAMLFVPKMAGFVMQTLLWSTGSSASHSKDWALGIRAMADYPLGAGLGTTDMSAIRNEITPLTADNLFLKFGVELGVLGFVLHVLVLAGIALYAYALIRRASTKSESALGYVVLMATAGVCVNGLTAVIYNSNVLSYLFFWLSGTAVALAVRPAEVVGPVLQNERA
jgi:hypothetical protein